MTDSRLLEVMESNRKVFNTWSMGHGGFIRRDVWLTLMGMMDTWDLERVGYLLPFRTEKQ